MKSKWNLWTMAATVLTVLAIGAGCRHMPVAAPGGESPAMTHQVVFAHRELTNNLFVPQISASYNENGCLTVKVSVQNTGNKDLELQFQTIFKDENGVPTGDETDWKLVMVSRGALVTYSTTSVNTKAKDFTVQIRKFRK